LPKVLITDADERAALATARSLGNQMTVHVAGFRDRSLAGSSRYVLASHCVPDPLREPEAFGFAVEALVRSRDIDFVVPISDAACTSLIPLAARLQPARLACPRAEAYHRASDKVYVSQLAAEFGMAVPAGDRATSLEHALALADELGWPVVVRGVRSIVREGAQLRKVGTVQAADPPGLARVWDRIASAEGALVQGVVHGHGEGLFVLRWGGKTRAAFAHRRLREKPPWGGVSVLRESIPVDRERLRVTEAILDRVGFDGAAMAEFKVDGDRAWLIEINGRLWGSLQLAIDAGVDFPALLLSSLLGEDTGDPPRPRSGVRLRWLFGDLDHAIALARGGRDSEGRSGIRAALSVLLRGTGPDSRLELWRRDDPRPFLFAFGRWIRGQPAGG
jgi:predicted ATP-grasp superfamily ATP-dependent carboligase